MSKELVIQAFSKVDDRGRITIPEQMRKHTDIKEGDTLMIRLVKSKTGQIIIIEKR